MGKVIMPVGSGAGSGSDECSSTRAEVLKGYTAITSDSDDESLEGTLELTGDASDSQVLAGKTYYNTNPKNKRVGSMLNQGAVSQTINAGESYTIPSGYHNGTGKVIASSLVNQTEGTATATQILNGQTAWVNGNKIVGSMAIQSILSFNAAVYSSTAIMFKWKNPEKGPFSGVIIVGKKDSYPTSVKDGYIYYKGYGNNANASAESSILVSNFEGGINYYFRIYTYVVKENNEWISTTSLISTASTLKGQQTFTYSGTFTVPASVRSIDAFCVGGGGSGGTGGGFVNTPVAIQVGGGGGGGYAKTFKGLSVIPGEILSINIGAGGNLVGGYKIEELYKDGNSGGESNIKRGNTTLVSALGGHGGRNGGWNPYGGSGGSGGGGGLDLTTKSSYKGGNGGSNGGNGENGLANYRSDATDATGGKGQGVMTKAFNESAATVYSGGGGGGSYGNFISTGGAGGGGAGAKAYNNNLTTAESGKANTGGGGGGTLYGPSGSGGSGIVIIRWGY